MHTGTRGPEPGEYNMATETTDRQLVTIVLVVIAALIVLPMLFMGFGMMGGGPMMGDAWGHGMWGDGAVTPGWLVVVWVGMRLVFLAALVGAVYLVYRAVTGGSGSADRAMEELRVAYARGELSDEEYERRRESLERDS